MSKNNKVYSKFYHFAVSVNDKETIAKLDSVEGNKSRFFLNAVLKEIARGEKEDK
jgi:hypothetical protein